jgi:ribosomal peptide maturation radical SAM protein 1
MPDLVQLVNPPFGAIERPSIGLSLLQASAQKAGFPCRTIYANLAFAERIGLDLYFWFSNTGEYVDLFGEWIFSGLLFPENEAATAEYIERFVLGGYSETTFRAVVPGRDLFETLFETRQLAADFVEDLARDIVTSGATVVGCTSSFQQNCAALAILKRVHELDSSVVTLMGGPNCEEPMGQGLRRAFPWLDFVVSGEAETAFPEMLKLILKHGRHAPEHLMPPCVIGAFRAVAGTGSQNVLGIVRNLDAIPLAGAESKDARGIVRDLDALPTPDYSDYFEQLARSPFAHDISPGLLLETSRGCWWGQKHHCTFCGLNGTSMGFRVKSPERVIREIEELCGRYGILKIEFIDNILDPRLGAKIFPRLAERAEPLSLFFEARVMDRPKMELMARGGVQWIQIGIESFHQGPLSHMDKGSSPLENIEVLRWAYELGIRVSYNLLCEFPGEDDAWYAEMSQIFPLLNHLEPPRSIVPLRYDRYSVYHDHPERFGLDLVPRKAYRFVYSLPPDLLADIACFFEDANESRDPAAERPGLGAVKREWLQWRHAFWMSEPGRERAVLHLLPFNGHEGRLLYDTRGCHAEQVTLLTELESRVLRFCDRARRLPEIEAQCSGNGQSTGSAIESLIRRNVLIEMDHRFLSLAVTPPARVFLQTKDFPGGFYYPHGGTHHVENNDTESSEPENDGSDTVHQRA